MTEIIAHVQQDYDYIQLALAIATVMIALTSIFYTARLFRVQREHYKKSVKPIVNIISGDYENNLFVKITNNGTGPAIIKSFKCSRHNESNTFNNIISIVKDAISTQELASLDEFMFTEQVSNLALTSNCEMILLSIKIVNSTESQKQTSVMSLIREKLINCSIVIEYTDIYDETQYAKAVIFAQQ